MILSSVILEQGACTNCTSSDAFTIYDDGHCKCFSCGHFIPPNRISVMAQSKEKKSHVICLPADSSSDLPVFTLEWLNKYDITLQEAREHRFVWSDKEQLLLFPIYGNDSTLRFWQGRYFGKEKKPKYNSRGMPKDLLHIISEEKGDEIILTEDLISAIKVGRQFPAMPIWGSFISIDQFKRLFLRFTKVGIWLDSDKLKEALKYASIGSQIGNTRVIYSELDPKCYSDNEIRRYVK